MKKILTSILVALLITQQAYAGRITKNYTFSAGQTISSSAVNSNYDQLFNLVNGNIEGGATGNLALDTITEANMADDINPRVRWDEGFRDFVYTGLVPSTDADLTTNIPVGTAYVNGYRVNKSSAVSHTFTASKDTYIDISDSGVFTYTEVSPGAAAPAVTTNSTRIAAVTTSGTAVTGVTDLRTLTPYVSTSVIVQVVNTQTGAVATGSTTIPADDTIPQKTEGDEYMTSTITPTSATNYLKIDIVMQLSGTSAGQNTLAVALFQDTTTDAIAAMRNFQYDANNGGLVVFSHYMVSGTTSATTFKVRAGGHAGTMTFNGLNGTRLYGGVMASSITITEIAV